MSCRVQEKDRIIQQKDDEISILKFRVEEHEEPISPVTILGLMNSKTGLKNRPALFQLIVIIIIFN
jgi:hypothetical protein